MPDWPPSSSGVHFNILLPHLGEEDYLAAVKPEIAGKHVGHSHSHGKGRNVPWGEKLYSQENRGQGAVHHRAEQGRQPKSGGKTWIQAQKRPCDTAKGSADEHGGHNFPALKPRPHAQGCEQKL